MFTGSATRSYKYDDILFLAQVNLLKKQTGSCFSIENVTKTTFATNLIESVKLCVKMKCRASCGTRVPGDRQLNLAPLRATNWKNIQLHHAKYWIISRQITISHWGS